MRISDWSSDVCSSDLPSIHEGGGTVPYDVVQDHPDCAADTPWAVTKQDTGDLMGCHATEADAREQQAALYAEEGDRDGDRLDYTGDTAPWEGVLDVEGINTGEDLKSTQLKSSQ